jgi:hypothetical protein
LLPATYISGNKYLLVATEYYTRWPLARACKRADATTAANFVYEEIVCVFGPPKVLLSYGGSHFDNKFIKELTNMVNFKHAFASPYHPETNGILVFQLYFTRIELESIAELDRLQPFDLGRMDQICDGCGAKHWKAELPSDSTSSNIYWNSCCKAGVVFKGTSSLLEGFVCWKVAGHRTSGSKFHSKSTNHHIVI